GIITGRWRFITLYQTWWQLLPGGALAALDIYLMHKIGRDFGSDRLIGRQELNAAQADNRLITTGMHARMRHPIYMAHLIMLSALTVASGLLVMYGLLAFAIVTGAFMIRTEDAELEKRFGAEYREYRKRVPAIFPLGRIRRKDKPSDATAKDATALMLWRMISACENCCTPLVPPHEYLDFASMIANPQHLDQLKRYMEAFQRRDWQTVRSFQLFEGTENAFLTYIIRCPAGGMALGFRDAYELDRK